MFMYRVEVPISKVHSKTKYLKEVMCHIVILKIVRQNNCFYYYTR